MSAKPNDPGAEACPMERKRSSKAIQLLLLLPFLGLLWVPLYNRHDPVLFGFPFFYWYQLLWIPVTAVLCLICYLLLRPRPGTGAGEVK